MPELQQGTNSEEYATQVMIHALNNQSMAPSVYKFAFYLYGRVRLAWAAATRIMQGDTPNPAKRSSSPNAE